MDGWITCDFTAFSTVFESYQDDEKLIMKGCVNETLFTVEKISPRAGIELGPLGYGRTDRRVYQKEDQDGLYKNKEAKRILQSTVKRI